MKISRTTTIFFNKIIAVDCFFVLYFSELYRNSELGSIQVTRHLSTVIDVK